MFLKKFFHNKRVMYPLLLLFFFFAFFLIVGLTYYFYTYYPTPHSFWISQLTPEQSEDIPVLKILYTMIAFGLFSLLNWIVFSYAYINYYLNQKIVKKWIVILVIFYSLIPILFFLLFIIDKNYQIEWEYGNNISSKSTKIKIITLKQKLAFKIKWIFNKKLFYYKTIALGIFTIGWASLYVATPLIISYIILNDIYVNKNTIKNFYKLSRKKNVVTLYFDAAAGHIFNKLLASKYIQKFSDFTSYTNTLSNGVPTLFSFPTILGGWDYLPTLFKKQEKTQEKFIKDSYFKFINTLSKNGIKNINMANFQYYGKQSSIDKLFWYGNMRQFEKEMPSYVHGTSNAAINEYYNKWHDWDNLACSKLLRDMPKYLEIDENKESTFIANFFLNTHIKLSYFDGNKDIHLASSAENQIKVIDQSMQMLIKIFDKFKKLGVYDNTMFIIVSDHGSSFNGVYKGYSKKEIDSLDYNPVFSIKPFRNQAVLNDLQREDAKINNQLFLSLADILTILNNYLGKKANDELKSKYFQVNGQNSNLLENPLNPLENKKRIMSTYLANDWRYNDISKDYLVKNKKTFKGSIFNQINK